MKEAYEGFGGQAPRSMRGMGQGGGMQGGMMGGMQRNRPYDKSNRNYNMGGGGGGGMNMGGGGGGMGYGMNRGGRNIKGKSGNYGCDV